MFFQTDMIFLDQVIVFSLKIQYFNMLMEIIIPIALLRTVKNLLQRLLKSHALANRKS